MTNNSLKTYSLGYVTALVVVVFLALLLSGCAPTTAYTSTGTEAPITTADVGNLVDRIIDTEAGVVCYLYAHYDGGGSISCLPINQTLLDPEEYR